MYESQYQLISANKNTPGYRQNFTYVASCVHAFNNNLHSISIIIIMEIGLTSDPTGYEIDCPGGPLSPFGP